MNALFLALSLVGTAHSQTFITSVGTDQVPGGREVGGLNWVRIFNNFEDGGWWLTYHWDNGTGPGYNVAPMDNNFVVDMDRRIRLAEWPDIKDHGISRCPDGSFLHAYSISVENDSARSARYSADWEILAEGWIEEDVDERAHNDMPLICSNPLQAVAFTNHSDMTATIFEIDAEANATIVGALTGGVHVSGAAWTYSADRDQYLIISNGDFSSTGLQRTWYNRDFSVAESVGFSVKPDLTRHFWPQGLMRLGDYWLIAFLGTEPDIDYLAGDGDVYVAVLNDDFVTQEVHKVSENVDGEVGSARPHFARYGDELVVVWDKEFLPHVVSVRLDLSAFGVTSDDTGFSTDGDGGDTPADEGYDPCTESAPDTSEPGTLSTDSAGGPTDTATHGSDDCAKKKGCGCASAETQKQPWWLVFGVLAAISYRRRI